MCIVSFLVIFVLYLLFLFLFGWEKRAARRQFVGAVSRLQLPLSKKRKKSERINRL